MDLSCLLSPAPPLLISDAMSLDHPCGLNLAAGVHVITRHLFAAGFGGGQKTETDGSRGFFPKTQLKSIDLGQCETVTTLLYIIIVSAGVNRYGIQHGDIKRFRHNPAAL